MSRCSAQRETTIITLHGISMPKHGDESASKILRVNLVNLGGINGFNFVFPRTGLAQSNKPPKPNLGIFKVLETDMRKSVWILKL